MKFIAINYNLFKLHLLAQEGDIIWFSDLLTSKNSEINTYFEIKFNDQLIGLLIDYKKKHEDEYGIFILNEFKRKGYGKNVVGKLILNSKKKKVSFIVNNRNSVGLIFFSSLLKNKLLEESEVLKDGRIRYFKEINFFPKPEFL